MYVRTFFLINTLFLVPSSSYVLMNRAAAKPLEFCGLGKDLVPTFCDSNNKLGMHAILNSSLLSPTIFSLAGKVKLWWIKVHSGIGSSLQST